MLHCYNRGCGQLYDPEKNTEESCLHHPGAPFFHDAYKGWSCCNRKSVDFTEFLNIKGCTLSKHSNLKPPEPEKQKQPKPSDLTDMKQETQVRAPIAESTKRPPINTPMTTLQPTVAASLKEAIDTREAKDPAGMVNKTIASGEIAVGTACKNSGCTYSYTGTSDDADCQYHAGVPIFHEGMKYWSCCQKKTSDFDVFMAQKGCAYGPHKWVKESSSKETVQCRYDWHQTGANVILSVYAKMYHYAESSIEVNPIRLHVHLVFPDQENAAFDLDLELRGIIDPANSTVRMSGTKVEITMPKAEPGSWPKLDVPARKPTVAATIQKQESSESEDDVNLDDIDTVNTGFRLAEICRQKNDLD